MITNCSRCQGSVQPIERAGQVMFYLCRTCKIPYDESGGVVINLNSLNSSFNPLEQARKTLKGLGGPKSPVARTAVESFMITALLEAYQSGLKDGVLLAYSQDVEKQGPV